MSEFPRALTDTECGVLELLLSIDFPGVSEYREQVRAATVTDRCPCGCLEFSVEVADGSPTASGPGLVSAWSEEQQVHLGLETHEGRLTGVGLMWFGEDDFRITPNLTTFEVAAEPRA